MPIRTSRAVAAAALLLWTLAGCAAQPAVEPPQQPAVESPKKGYLLFRSVFPDPTAIRAYGRAVLPLVAEFGGRFIVTADAPVAIEGSPDTRRVVIIEFPSLAAAREFWSSAAYAEVKTLRTGVGEVDAVLFEGR